MNLKKHSQTLSSWTGRLVACLLPLLLTLTANAGEQLYFYHTDHLGTPQVMTDVQGQVVWEGHYRPFGEVELTVEGVGSNLRFPGQYFDEETNLYYNYFRDYDPTTGRYLQSDPIGLDGGLNTYLYVNASPTNYVDPKGQATEAALGSCFFGGFANPICDGAIVVNACKWLIVGGVAVAMSGDTCNSDSCQEESSDEPLPPFPLISDPKQCQLGERIVLPIGNNTMVKKYKNGTNIEQEYICPEGVFTRHTIISSNGVVVHDHFRPGPPKGTLGG